ncbi:dihydrofolate synthase/folylpolyglutamate synthase [Desulfohalotomaculum tongense]|uniref:bifunctional folylpolyglutamate synthase/dihydrofolate synthase n=1 Tax=Desulforadius tongensis TaxID=1216062 RepID=UPI00195EE946|nr:folylpolyglutamate synthase/dihydrofolate synthase family protein [Desulforadius tongensis]MBM7854539.1 dihydrofolate synthase/folylpolyglutamate synthase [Desulforadius tongensis]
MNYLQARDYLKNLTKFGINLGLDRIKELLRRLGSPHLQLKVIHVGGTNGKGSTTSMIASILRAAGYKVGTFTSPHLHRYTERCCINGEEIKEQQVADLVNQLKPHLEDMCAAGFEHPTEFEVSTAMACCYFHRQRVDFAVLEVGLGGEIDSTNVVQPLVSVITNVSLDHMDYLGHTIEEVARVKAGIIKENVPVVTAAREPEALAVIKETCLKRSAPLTIVGRDITWQAGKTGAHHRGQHLAITGRLNHYPDIYLPLLGLHQQVNAATAVAALEILSLQGITITPDIVRRGLAGVKWPGRFEILPGQPAVVLDGAHNAAGARSLVQTLKQQFAGRRMVLVLGMLSDKERQKVIDALVPLAAAVVVTKPNNPRCGNWRQVADWARRYIPRVYVREQVPRAVDTALDIAGLQDVVCVTGSLYMLAEAREYLLKLKNEE